MTDEEFIDFCNFILKKISDSVEFINKRNILGGNYVVNEIRDRVRHEGIKAEKRIQEKENDNQPNI